MVGVLVVCFNVIDVTFSGRLQHRAVRLCLMSYMFTIILQCSVQWSETVAYQGVYMDVTRSVTFSRPLGFIPSSIKLRNGCRPQSRTEATDGLLKGAKRCRPNTWSCQQGASWRQRLIGDIINTTREATQIRTPVRFHVWCRWVLLSDFCFTRQHIHRSPSYITMCIALLRMYLTSIDLSSP